LLKEIEYNNPEKDIWWCWISIGEDSLESYNVSCQKCLVIPSIHFGALNLENANGPKLSQSSM